MADKMLIDATHPEETRVVVLRGNRVEEFDFESANRKQLRGNIYLAKVTRVEPSLQAAFVDYGGNRHGFLAFSEIHPDYYRIPVSDRGAGDRDQADRDQGDRDQEDRESSEYDAPPAETVALAPADEAPPAEIGITLPDLDAPETLAEPPPEADDAPKELADVLPEAVPVAAAVEEEVELPETFEESADAG